MNKLMIVAATGLLMVGAAQAKPGHQGGCGENGDSKKGGPNIEKMQQELNLSSEQSSKIEAIFSEQHQKREAQREANQDAKKQQREARMEERKLQHEQMRERLEEVLSAEQMQQFDEKHQARMEKRKEKHEERREQRQERCDQ